MAYTVYKHTCPNNKVYIGITSTSVNQRWGNDGIGYKRQVFGRAIEKYGWDNIAHTIVAENLSKDEAEEMEKELISFYKSSNGECGYNIALGGQGTCGVKLSEEQVKARSELVKQYWQDEEYRNKQLCHLEKCWANKRGTPTSDETKQKMSLAQKGKPKDIKIDQAHIDNFMRNCYPKAHTKEANEKERKLF